MGNWTATIKRNFVEALPPTIFFFVILQVIAIAVSLVTYGTMITLDVFGSVALIALVMGKSVLFANLLPFVNRFPEKPLMWNVLWKTGIYALVAIVARFIERLYHFWKPGFGFLDASHALALEINWARFWGIHLLLVTLLAMYCVLAELARVLGRERLRVMFFGPLPLRRIDL
ncbi:hypothetical protein NOV72_01023 [Caballeronia novacaledonica]|uniref:Uncharacterized protein n=1 Tax=Caballeronia novacaledonica TaxID=1544861 RepID=A0A2U3I0X9_9BURK|nr:hypothetical protein [Caballeronia novacaledonica]SPB13759.1 hypothetical protein NOV72_01023 [Caballeronia novacaledonica]